MSITVEWLQGKCAQDGDCLIWKGAMGGGNGCTPYGWHQGKVVNVRRQIWKDMGRSLGAKTYVIPKCGNPKCVCPDHLARRLAGPPADFSHSALTRIKIGAAMRRNHAKLDREKVRAIRESGERVAVIADQYQVSVSLIYKVLANQSWREYSSPFVGLGARA